MVKNEKFKILIVDDSMFNRELLCEILEDDYEVIEAENGKIAIEKMSVNPTEYSVVLLDINMPVLDGFGVLTHMNQNMWINNVPVIMISSEIDRKTIQRAYELGATDFINRPYDAGIVKQRVKNTILLYAKQRKMANILVEQMYEKEKSTNLMVSILSHIVEFRNGESGAHILNVNRLTEKLLRALMAISDRYELDNKQISLICTASALHDIGKISIDEAILNKPGKLTKEEFEIMKTHSKIGADMLAALPNMQEEPLIQYGYEICRWHHERYDGNGYPDHLVGDEIPISAQIVSLADVYDALTAERCYKKAFSHEVAMDMILRGECGVFNPLLLECLKNVSEDIRKDDNNCVRGSDHNITQIKNEISKYDDGLLYNQKIKRLEIEREKVLFFIDNIEGICFTHRYEPEYFKITNKASELLGISDLIVDPKLDKDFNLVFGDSFLDRLAHEASLTTIDKPNFNLEAIINIKGELYKCIFICRAIWISDEANTLTGSIGRTLSIVKVVD